MVVQKRAGDKTSYEFRVLFLSIGNLHCLTNPIFSKKETPLPMPDMPKMGLYQALATTTPESQCVRMLIHLSFTEVCTDTSSRLG